jgi:branched-chain amino acid transport system permease protein
VKIVAASGLRRLGMALLVLGVLYALHGYYRAPERAYVRGILVLAGINIILAVSLNLINGTTGQFSIGHAGFMAVGAYASAGLTKFGGSALEAHRPGLLHPAQADLGTALLGYGFFALALLAGGMVAAGLGLCVGLPTLRLRGDYLAIATLGFGEIVKVLLLNTEAVGGASGLHGIPPYTTLFGVYLVVVLTVLTIVNLMRSAYGRAWLAVRENEVAAEAVGIDTTRYKVLAFVIGAFFAGLAGGLFAHEQKNLVPTNFTFLKSIEVIAMVVLGGSGSTSGAILAALGLTFLPEVLRGAESWRMVLYAITLIVMMLVRREGLMGHRELSGTWLKQRIVSLRVSRR